jgi:hypothetical protein
MSAIGYVFGSERIGIVRTRRHLAYGVNHGALCGWPHWLINAIVGAWNFVVCHTLGHDTFGPWEEPPDEDGKTLHVPGFRPGYYPKTCAACSKRWPEVTT